MKVNVRTLKGEIFEVDIEPEQTVEEFKRKIAEAKPELLVEQQKLIYVGKILVDAQPIQEYAMKPGDMVVVMVAKVKAPAAPQAAALAAAPAQPQPPVSQPAAAQAGGAASQGGASSANLVGPEMEATIARLCDMGFAREEVERCLQAAFNNPNRAVEYLMSGIPDGIIQPVAAGASGLTGGSAPIAAPSGPSAGVAMPNPFLSGGTAAFPPMPSGGGGHGGAAGALEELRNHPRFEELGRMLVQNPQHLPQILAALQLTNPGLAQAITENEEEFFAMLAEVAEDGEDDDSEEEDPVEAMLAAAHNAQGGTQVQLSDEEMAAIERLSGLGFDRAMCIEAYLACDKNEEVAASYLFELVEEEEDDDGGP